jgi:hypothetical protein
MLTSIPDEEFPAPDVDRHSCEDRWILRRKHDFNATNMIDDIGW